ncbi:hypothetical protein CPLU01_15043, partial [Colletotrichum plurivorum]
IKDACAADSRPSPDPPPPPPRPPVSPTGDVILLVGPESHEIRTHSLILANASPVFAAMLLGTYNTSESAAVRSATSLEPAYISLPDDDPSAMETICLALETKRNHLRLALQIILTERIHLPAWNDVFNARPSNSSFWTRRTRVRRLPRPEHEPSSNVLRAIDHELFSRGMPYMSISEAMRRAVEVPAAAKGRTFSLGRFFRGELGGGEVPWHKTWMARGVREFREKRVEGLCLACLHPQMRCEREHEGDRGRREWEVWVGMEGGGCLP